MKFMNIWKVVNSKVIMAQVLTFHVTNKRTSMVAYAFSNSVEILC